MRNSTHFSKGFSTAIDVAIAHIKNCGASDLFAAQPETEKLIEHRILAKQYIKKIDDLILSNSPVCFLPTTEDLFVTAPFKFRLGAMIDPLLNLYATSVLVDLSPKIERMRIEVEKGRVFSYRVSKNITSDWFRRDVGWTGFNDATIKNTEKFKFVALLDISQFYKSLSSNMVMSAFQDSCYRTEERARLSQILKYLGVDEKGLPVGGSFSRLLAEAAVCPVDMALEKQGINFTRFVDDFRIFANDREELNRQIYAFTKLLNQHGLRPNNHKIGIMESAQILEDIDFQKTPLIVEKAKSKFEKPIIVRQAFDPYSELVIGKVEELKNISGTSSIAAAVSQELEKSTPSMQGLKVFTSALMYSTDEDCIEVAALLFAQMHRAELLILLLRLMNILRERAMQFSDEQNAFLSNSIEASLIKHCKTLPDSAAAVLLFGLQHLKHKCTPEFVSVLGEHLRGYECSAYLSRQILFLAAQQEEKDILMKFKKIVATRKSIDTPNLIWLDLAMRYCRHQNSNLTKSNVKNRKNKSGHFLIHDFLFESASANVRI